MVIVTLTLALLLSSCIHAAEGIITVLEAPLFSKPDEKSKILQYKRKGSKVYIHSAEVAFDRYRDEEFIIDPKKFKIHNKDRFISDDKIYVPQNESPFYKTLTRDKKEAYILKEHLFIEYKDKRELTQKVIKHDNTDYRLIEPIPDGYPFKNQITGYRGHTSVSLGQPNFQPYPYKQYILDTAYDLNKDFSFTYSRVGEFDTQRLFFGVVGGMSFSTQKYVLTSQIAKQNNSRVYIGPYLSYDVYSSASFYISSYISFQFLVYDEMKIFLNDNATKNSETRTYLSPFSMQPSLGSSINLREAFFEFDLTLGFNIKGMLPKTYTAEADALESEFWTKTTSEDKYSHPFRAEISYTIGVQALY